MKSELYLALGHFKCANYSILNRKLTLFSIIPRLSCIIFNSVCLFWNMLLLFARNNGTFTFHCKSSSFYCTVTFVHLMLLLDDYISIRNFKFWT